MRCACDPPRILRICWTAWRVVGMMICGLLSYALRPASGDRFEIWGITSRSTAGGQPLDKIATTKQGDQLPMRIGSVFRAECCCCVCEPAIGFDSIDLSRETQVCDGTNRRYS